MVSKLIIIILVALLGASQASCAKEIEREVVIENKNSAVEKEMLEEIEEMVNEAINQPTEYVMPGDVMAIMQNAQTSWNIWKGRIEDIEKTITLEKAKIAIAKANQRTDSQTIVHTMRTHLAGQGVQDLGNWKMEGNKAVRNDVPPVKE